jgi:two-component system, chemotaxis family, chemotaxis protein CheY
MQLTKTILVVEDFASIRQFICETLHRKGYQTLAAGNGTAAYEMVSSGKTEINLILTDYNMPDCNGYDLLIRLKQNSLTRMIPVVFLTTESNPVLIKKAREAGLAAWVKKPYRSDAFYEQIGRAMNQNPVNTVEA